ncbi:hypothetical protein H257_19173 [Aphanomyces astaci]|uniref:Uncharacterized protein n=1 Tax=Aphanomyces astaci TaxID=112090 RepID=W4FAE0_APHAT|nr:hypothetical protein H257_19173 [Aphanomyces astaci]ETV63894.1 hypothetical protein H257_19173 [Aphanomyces astaci]|eukprot:XP_009846621.1 hypothetical protein H257_19173 [Aphanomyces astaci]
MHDEDFMTKCGEWLHMQPPSERSPERFQRHLNNDVIPLLTGAVKANVSESTARRWMQQVGYRYGLWKKNVYTDGHGRDDVKSYRETFCKSFHGFATRMRYYCGDGMATVEHPRTTNESEIVWVAHDESVFCANDDGGKDFLCPCHGRLYNMVNGVKKYTTQTLHVGSNNEGYWTCEYMIKQIQEEVVAAFNEMHPGGKGYITFDQSTNHAAFAPDALRASNTSLKPGSAQTLLRPGRLLDGTTQSMVFEKQVLLELGYDVKLLKLSLFCKQTHLNTCQSDVRMCCARHCKASQKDFRAQLSLLEETIISAGHICAFLPKYHCKLNPIESFWGAPSATRSHCDYSFEGLKTCVPQSLDFVPLTSIRKVFRRCAHFIEAYSFEYDYELTRFAHTKYKSHR